VKSTALLLLAAWPAFAQPIPKLKLGRPIDFGGSVTTKVIRNLPRGSVELWQVDPDGRGDLAVLEKRTLRAPSFTITASMEVTTGNECVAGLVLSSRRFSNHIVFGVQPKDGVLRLVMIGSAYGPIDLVPPAPHSGGLLHARIHEDEFGRDYYLGDGVTWQRVFHQDLTKPDWFDGARYGVGLQTRRATPEHPGCHVNLIAFEEKP
jgi:hypothetical protein